MSEPLANYGFLSWMRRGVATRIDRPDGGGAAAPRAVVFVHVGFNADTKSVDVPLELLGSGELSSFDVRSVIRTWPRDEVADAESNYFPLIEFREPDLPWRLTPATAATSGRLRPWMVLIVLRDEEGTFHPATRKGALASIVVPDSATLPDLAATWAWAHVQVSNEPGLTPDKIRDLVNTQSAFITSRLLCPRRLEPLTRYTAYLVPAFERGRLSGLRQPVPDTVDALAPAWTTTGGATLPVFYSWRFHTAEEGDFEALVRRLEPRLLPPEVGIRPMSVADPGGALRGVPANDAPLALEGALRTVRTQSTPWPDSPTKARFVDRMRRLVNAPDALLNGPNPQRAVTPPLYGRWHAAQPTLEPGAKPVWFHELNQDPRLRVTSGLGTQVVQAEQRELMAGAWLQVEGIRVANEARRLAQLARGAALRLYARHVLVGGDESILALTTRLHAKVKGSPTTLRALLAKSPVPLGVLDTTWRRVSRPRGTIGRRQGRVEHPPQETFFARLNRGELKPGVAPPVPATLPTIGGLAAASVPESDPAALPPWLQGGRLVLLMILVVLLLAVMVGALGLVGLVGFVVIAAIAIAMLPPAVRDALRRVIAGLPPAPDSVSDRARRDLANERFTRELVELTPPRPTFQLRQAPPLGEPLPAPGPRPPGAAGRVADSVDAREFRAAASDLMASLGAPLLDVAPMQAVALQAMRQKVQVAIDPRVTIVKGVLDRTTFSPDLVWEPEDPLEEIMVYPKFPQPMFESLRDLGQDWLLPGLELIPSNTVALVASNQRMIEAYMVGLNHEMSRELLWNEFPTDQRGSYFRQFWNVRGVAPPGGDADKLRDIREIHAWIKRQALGQNSARPPMPNGEERLVLLVRGDLFRRYPNTEVYALSAKADPSGKRTLGENRLDYDFYGRLDPDVNFFGFSLTPSQAVGAVDATDPTVDQGWFFVLQEQPAEPRFGLDIGGTFDGSISEWNNLSWTSLARDPADLAGITFIDLNRDLPDVRPLDAGTEPAWHADAGLGRLGAQAAHLAYITLQQPVRIAIHGSDMLRGTQ